MEVKLLKMCALLWREAHFQVKSVKQTDDLGALFEVRMWFCAAGARDSAPGFCSSFKHRGKRGAFERICEDAFCVAGAVQETHESEMLGPGDDFLRGVAFWSLGSSGLLRRFCVTSAALPMTWPHFFVAGAVL